ncbi:unnamed protein product, partial [Mesorhabditis belari]|uniref:Uncharacterized protein n=1 Tax=Mesorhabditis belari TaxID=2138241 RepID=A0AAF3F7H1_9BILA
MPHFLNCESTNRLQEARQMTTTRPRVLSDTPRSNRNKEVCYDTSGFEFRLHKNIQIKGPIYSEGHHPHILLINGMSTVVLSNLSNLVMRQGVNSLLKSLPANPHPGYVVCRLYEEMRSIA